MYAPVDAVSSGRAGHVLLAPGDTGGTAVIPERCDGCCGSAGGLGPNLACAGCGHPRTGEVWQPVGPSAAVPLDAEVWVYLAFPRGRARLPATGRLPAGVQRDDPLPPRPPSVFRPDRALLLHTLARLPAVREPWLREVYDKARGRP